MLDICSGTEINVKIDHVDLDMYMERRYVRCRCGVVLRAVCLSAACHPHATQTSGKIQEVDPPIHHSNTPMV